MLSLFSDMNDTFQWMGSLERQMERALRRPRGLDARDSAFRDHGDEYRLTVDLPGVADSDVEITVDGDTLRLKASRADKPLAGYALVRSERPHIQIAHELTLPGRVKAESVTAELVAGVLTIRLPKADDARPRKITLGTTTKPQVS